MNAMTHCFPVDENTYKDDDVVATVRALRPQLNHEIIEILVPRKTKLYARFVRRLKIVCNVYADYSNAQLCCLLKMTCCFTICI